VAAPELRRRPRDRDARETRNHAAREAGQKRDDTRKERHAPVEPDIIHTREARREARPATRDAAAGHQQARHSSGDTEERTLDDPLTD
jgi:hypothetical protein